MTRSAARRVRPRAHSDEIHGVALLGEPVADQVLNERLLMGEEEKRHISSTSSSHKNYIFLAWPIAFAGLQIRDAIYYALYPQYRFRSDQVDLFLGKELSNFLRNKGLSANPFLWTSDLSVTKIGDNGYWWLTVVVSTAYIASEVAQFIIFRPSPSSVRDRYQRPSGGQRFKNFLCQSVYGLVKTYSIYSAIRLMEFLLTKTIELSQHQRAIDGCQHGAYIYLSYLAHYVCTLCGDWSNAASVTKLTDADACFASLLSDPNDVTARINRIYQRQHNLSRVNFSAVNWLDLPVMTQQQLLTGLTENPTGLFDSVDFSITSSFNQSAVNQTFFNDIIRFINRINITRFTFNGWQAGATLMPVLFALTNNLGLRQVTLQNQQLTADYLAPLWLSSLTANWNFLDISRNAFTNFTSNFSHFSSLREVSVAENILINDALRQFLVGLQDLPVERLDASDAVFDEDSASIAASLLLQSQFRELDASNGFIDDNIFYALSTAFVNSSVESLDLSRNFLSDASFQQGVTWPLSLRSLALRQQFYVSPTGLISLFPTLNANLTAIDLSNNGFNADVALAFSQWLSQSSVQRVVLSQTGITDEILAILAEGFADISSLAYIDLSGNFITSNGAISLFQNLANRTGITLTLARTQVADEAIFYLVDHNITFRALNLDNTAIDSHCVDSLIDLMANPQTESLSIANNEGFTDNDMRAIAQSLTTYPGSLDSIVNSRSYSDDLIYASAQSRTPQLKFLNIQNTHMQNTTLLLYRYLLPQTSLALGGLLLDDGPSPVYRVDAAPTNSLTAIIVGVGILFVLTLVMFLLRVIQDLIKICCPSSPTCRFFNIPAVSSSSQAAELVVGFERSVNRP